MIGRICFVLTVGCFLASTVLSQASDLPKTPGKVVSDSTYSAVLDTIFPRRFDDNEKDDWSLHLRFQPNDRAEFQITIRKKAVGFDVYLVEATNGIVFNRINDSFNSNGVEDVESMTKLVATKRTSYRLTKTMVNRIRDSFIVASRNSLLWSDVNSKEFDRTGAWTVSLHSSTYQVWFVSNKSVVTFLVSDVSPTKSVSGSSPIAKWMNSVRVGLDKPQR